MTDQVQTRPKGKGGCFAPKITDGDLVRYKELAASLLLSEANRGYMADLIKMVEVFNETPESSLPAEGFLVTPLEEAEVKRIWEYVPWQHEIDMMDLQFGKIPADGVTSEHRNAAFHLLWYATELTLDREPRTKDKLPQ